VIDGPFRQLLPRLTPPLIRLYRTLRLTPNQVTAGGFALACVAALCVAGGWPLVAIVVWWLGRLLDGTDGIYARETGQVSDFGGYLDIVLDMASYGVMVLGLRAWRPELDWAWAAMLFLYVLCITSALALGGLERGRGLGSHDNRSLRLSAGLAEGGETGLAYTAFLLFPQALPVLAVVWVLVLAYTVGARTLLARRLLP
jgi:phosphatidylglycerophosphate synthase